MYNEIINNLGKQLSSKELEMINSKKIHLAIFAEPYLSYMLDGRKTIESRFSKNKIAPYNSISKDNIVLVKKSGGDILAYFKVKDVLFFDLEKEAIDKIRVKYENELCVSDEFWSVKANSRYATLIFIDKLVSLERFHINKKGMQTWIVLKDE